MNYGGVVAWSGFGRFRLLRLLTLLVVFLLLQLGSVTAVNAAGSPQLVIESAVHNFGVVNQGEKVSHDFVLRNDGSAVLYLNRIVAACGCTATSLSENEIQPGKTGSVNVVFDTAGLFGEKLKTVRLFTNDPSNPAAILTVRGVVQPEVEVDPPRIIFPDVVRGAATGELAQELRISVRAGSSAKIIAVNPMTHFIVVSELASSPTERRLKVVLAPDAPPGEIRERIVVSLAGGKVPALNVPVVVSVRGPVVLRPATLSFGVIDGDQPLVRKARLESSSGEPLQVTSVVTDSAAVSVKYEVVKDGKIVDIVVTVDPRKVKSDLRATAKIRTNLDAAGPLSLALFGILPPKGGTP